MILNKAVQIAAQGLSMQRARMELVASNIANAQTTHVPGGGPYKRQLPLIQATPVGGAFGDEVSRAMRGVQVSRVLDDPRPPILKFEPGHPDADAKGYVAYPNIDPVEETVDMLSAIRSYEANVNVIKQVRRMNEDALSLVRG